MCYEGGIREFVAWLNRSKTPLHEQVIYLSADRGDSQAEVAMQYNDSYNELLLSFANNIHTPEGGMARKAGRRGVPLFQHGSAAELYRRLRGYSAADRSANKRRAAPCRCGASPSRAGRSAAILTSNRNICKIIYQRYSNR